MMIRDLVLFMPVGEQIISYFGTTLGILPGCRTNSLSVLVVVCYHTCSASHDDHRLGCVAIGGWLVILLDFAGNLDHRKSSLSKRQFG
jgi:hypothetical protein